MKFRQTKDFAKEFKKLAKKYKSLPEDLELFKKVISVTPKGNKKHFNIINQKENIKSIKARLFCRYLKGAALRIVYAYNDNKIELVFIEVYFKGDKEN
jgi:Txe/YoeB family toxin of Txe-Axe toxin-antitoxin module